MGNIGFWQILLVVLVVVLLFGAGKIPRLMKDIGGGIKAFKKGLNEEDDDKGDHKPKEIKDDKDSKK